MDPGDLDTQITIEAQSSTRDAAGQPLDSWAPITGGTNVWAKIESLSGREALLAQSNQATTTHRITIRTLDGITPRMRATTGARVFNFAAPVRPIGTDRQFIEIDAVEIV